jgi:hypothetical protein
MKTRQSGWTSRTSGKKTRPIKGTLMYNLNIVGKACDAYFKRKGLA